MTPESASSRPPKTNVNSDTKGHDTQGLVYGLGSGPSLILSESKKQALLREPNEEELNTIATPAPTL